jgi:small GTP-binding protein
MTETDYDYIFKYIVIGDSGAGKTSLCNSFVQNKFDPYHDPTIGIDFFSRIIEIDKQKLKIQLWDSAGNEKFRSITQQYYRGTTVVLLVYDITDRSSFKNILAWIQDIQKYCNSGVCVVLVGNKLDLASTKRRVYTQEGQNLARDYKFLFYETSAKKGLGMYDIIQLSAKHVIQELMSGHILPNETTGVRLNPLQIENDSEDKKNPWCAKYCVVM